MATKIHYFGDVSIASKYKAAGEILLETLRKTNFVPSSLNRDFSDGTKVIAKRVTPDMETIDIWAGVGTTEEDRYVWTLIYAPCPLPDPQDWEGWIEADRDTLVATNFLGMFSLVGFGMPFYGDFTTDDDLTYEPSSGNSLIQGGWTVPGVSNDGSYYGLCQEAIGLERINISRNSRTLEYTFPANLFNSVSLTDWNEGGVKHWVGGGWPDENKWVVIPSNPPPYGGGSTPPLAVGVETALPNDPGYTRGHAEGIISWESLYMIGFWKWELIAYTPSSYLNEDNYCGFYDYYTSDYSYSDTYLTDYWQLSWRDVVEDLLRGGYYFSAQMTQEYIEAISSEPDHIDFSHSWLNEYTILIPDPDSDGSGNSIASKTYETHFAGKYEGVYFDEIIGTATYSGTTSDGKTSSDGEWSGDNVFPWMSRMYSKAVLLEGEEGQEEPSDHNLMLASWLIGPAATLPGMGAAWETPGLVNGVGIDRTVYRMKHGSTEVTKEYSASHPGWHDVYTDEDGRTWRAYGDLFAALKKVRG